MSRARTSSTLRLRRLSALLRQLREEAGMTTTQVAKELRWAPGRLNNWERNKWARPDTVLIERLLDLYGVGDVERRDQILTLVRESRERGWWQAHKDELSAEYSTYIGLEAGASELLSADLVVVTGLLQTEEYARAVLKGGPFQFTEEQIEQRIKVRLRRQELLTRNDDPVRLWVVIDEAALRRQIGGPKVLRGQLEHLCRMAELPRVTIQVVPFELGSHAAQAGGFTILRFPEAEDPDAVYVETLADELFAEIPSEVEIYHLAFRRLQTEALTPEASISMIADVRDGLAS